MKHLFLFATAVVMTCFSSFAFSGKGGGTDKDPYQITNADEFFEIRNELDAHYKLMNDIDLAEFIKEDNPTQGWSPIGNTTTPFTGVLNGNNKSVMGLYINRPTVDNIGLFGCVNRHSIYNLGILNAYIVGRNNVGSLIGLYAMDSLRDNEILDNHVENIIIQNTRIFCEKNGGGVIGEISILNNKISWSISETNTSIVKGCYVTGTVSSKENAGGISGYVNSGEYHWYMDKWSYESQYPHKVLIEDNIVDVDIRSEGLVGGITSVMDASRKWISDKQYYEWWLHDFEITRNIIKGTIRGYGIVCGIAQVLHGSYLNGEEYSINATLSNNLTAIDTICNGSSKEIYKIANLAFPNNYSFAGTEALWNKTPITLEDNDFNGTSYGLKTLKKRTTYEGMGFDFGSQWAIKEGETFPYNINQSNIPEINEFVGGSRAYISGKANGTGQVFVFVSGNLFESYVVDNEWKVDLGNIPVGTEAKVSVALDGKMPSIQVSAVAESGTTNPTVKAGDANGDGVIDAADVVSIINYIIGKSSSSFNSLNADVNGDGQVLVDDAVGAVELIMNAQ